MREYVRKFDWDEAKRLRKQGMTYKAIAETLGVSVTAVSLACNPRQYAINRQTTSAYQRRGTCVDCGERISSNYSKAILRCRECSALHQATTVRDSELLCSSCREWKPDTSFPFSRSEPSARRGRHGTCSECQTRLRKAYRERHKVPCANGCGTMVEDCSRHSRSWTGLCRACWQESRRDVRPRRGSPVDEPRVGE